jgi:FG-GAP repeat
MAVIYRRNTQSGIWEEQTRLTNPDAQEGDQFGSAVCITPDYAFAGSPTDTEDGIFESGSVTLFKKLSEGLWYVHEKFTCPHATPSAKFAAVSMTTDENRFITGARGISQSRGMVIFGRVK